MGGVPARKGPTCNYDLCLSCARVPSEEATEEMCSYFHKAGMPVPFGKKLVKAKARGIHSSDSSQDDSDDTPIVNDVAHRAKLLTEEMRAMERPRSAQSARKKQADDYSHKKFEWK